MSTRIRPATTQYFSHEAIQKDRPQEATSESWLKRAILSCEKEQLTRNLPSAARGELRSADSGAVIPREQIQEILQGIKARIRMPGHVDPLQIRIDKLADFLMQLRDSETSPKDLFDAFNQLDPEDQVILRQWVCEAHQNAMGDPREKPPGQDPRVLLRMLDPQGNNCVERLIERLHSSRTASNSQTNRPIFGINREESYLSQQFSYQKSLYSQIAQTYAANLTEENHQQFFQEVGYIPDPRLRFEIAKLCATKNGWATASHIQNFGITDEAAKIEIAKLCARQNGKATAMHIQDFAITDEAARIEIAKLCARQSGYGTAYCIQAFGITDEAARIEIAKLCARQDGRATAQFIQNFGITDEAARIEIAKLCVRQYGFGTPAEHIQNFEIKNEATRIEIAKLCATQNGLGTAKHIRNFGITSEATRIEIAKLCATQNGLGTALSIKNFEIKDEATRIDIAKLCVTQDGQGTALSIKNFEIKDEATRIEIAKLCATQNGLGTALSIKNFEIKDEATRIEIAKLCARQDGSGTARFIQRFEISDATALFKVAHLCVLQNGCDLYDFVDALFYTIPEPLRKILKACCVSDMILKGNLSAKGEAYFNQHLYPALQARLSQPEYASLKALFKGALDKVPLTRDAMKKLSMLQIAFSLLPNVPLTEDIQKTLVDIINYRNPGLSMAMLRTFCEEVAPNMAIYTLLLRKKEYLRLPMITIAKWLSECLPGKDLEPKILEPKILELKIAVIQTYIQKMRDDFKNKDGPLQMWLLTARALDQQSLPPARKIELFAQMGQNLDQKDPSTDLKKRLSCIQAFCAMGNAAFLNQDFSGPITKTLSDALAATLQQDPYIDLRGVAECTDKYLSTFGKMRVPNAWKTYEMQIQQGTNDPAVQKAFEGFMISVLNGNRYYSEYRYREDTPHIVQITERHREVWNRWKAPVQGEHLVMSESSSSAAPFSFRGFVLQKLRDGHLRGASGQEIFPRLAAFLNNPEGGENRLPQCTTAQASSANLLLRVEEQIMELCLHQPPENQLADQLRKLEEAFRGITCEFINDIRGLKQSLAQKQSKDRFEVIDTDDWQDLFLSGTEVAGSCQRVDGSADLNKCLLAYVIDGKNRMLAIKDPQTGKIMARCIFRLLWDPRNGRPVLFQDRIYPSPCPPAFSEALNRYAKERAHQMGCPLYTIDERPDTRASQDELVSLGSRAPFEYEDASDGVMAGGRFTIHHPRQVNLGQVTLGSA